MPMPIPTPASTTTTAPTPAPAPIPAPAPGRHDVESSVNSSATAPATLRVDLTDEELALLRATVAFQAQSLTDPMLRARLESTARKLENVAAGNQRAA